MIDQFIKGVLCGLCMGALPWTQVGMAIVKYDAGLAVCEVDLPRSQKCVLKAVPMKLEEQK